MPLSPFHAPPTASTIPCCQLSSKLIHAPARGATLRALCMRLDKNVSIHAPARGATAICCSFVLSFSFQSTPLREGRLAVRTPDPCGCEFQSTPLREGRRENDKFVLVVARFNPRPCARGDCVCNVFLEYRIRFQSTPLREGRR